MRKLILIGLLFMLSLIAIAHSVRRPAVQAAMRMRQTADTVKAPQVAPAQRPKMEKTLTTGDMLQREAQTIYAELYSLQSLDSRLLLDMNIDLREVDLLPDCSIYFEPWLIGATDSLALPPIIINGPQSDRMYLRRKALNSEVGEGAPYAILRQNNHRFPNMNYRINNIPYEDWMNGAHIRIKHRACDCDARLKPVNVSYKIKETPFDVALRVDTFDIIVHDTTYIDVHDTTYIDVHDTTYIPVHDTTYIYVHDTTYIPVHDTTYIPVHDTTYIDVHDTTYIPVHDTTYIDIHDTTYIPVHDTTVVIRHDTVTLTNIVTKYDTITLTNTVIQHDTVRIEVPVYRQAPDMDETAVAPQQKAKRRKRLFGRSDNRNKDAVPESEITEKKARETRKEKEP